MELKPIQSKKIYQEIVIQIKDLMLNGDLKPGSKLPSEREMADRLKVSRSSVREALSALHLMGLLEIKQGEGTYIKQFSSGAIIDSLALIIMMEQTTLKELLQVRKGLEVQAAALAAQNATDDQIAKMELFVEEMKNDLSKGDLGESADWKFHYAIAEASQNTLLWKLMNTISDTMKQTLRTYRLRLYTEKNMPERLFEDHNNILKAIKSHNVPEARKWMYQHLHLVEKQMNL